jgi:tetratricopeptide (TPR) repeat protein
VQARGELSEWQLTMLGIAASESGRPHEAIDWLKQGVSRAQREFGAGHPRTLEMRAYLCKGYLDLGDYQRAEDECAETIKRLAASAPDQTKLAARLDLYRGGALARLGQRDAARAALLHAASDDDLKGEALTELAKLDGIEMDWMGAARHAQESLDGDLAIFPPSHANVIIDRLLLGQALLRAGDAAGAVAALAPAIADVDVDEISPLITAELRFCHAQALWQAQPARRGEAVELARLAQRGYRDHAPDSAKYRDVRAEIDAWLSSHS